MAATCIHCGKSSSLISRALSLCAHCIKRHWEDVREHVASVHATGRFRFGLPAVPPRAKDGALCRLCANGCSIPPGAVGYCGLRRREADGAVTGGVSEANVGWYYDPLPTNCVGDWVCAGGTGCGYPEFAYSPGPEHGHNNLAVFFRACSFDCLYCQNWQYRHESTRPPNASVNDLVNAVDANTSCICYFGGDPSPQLPYSIAASERVRRLNPGRILRICWETNGSMNPAMLHTMASLSLESGGCIKFDLKAWDENLHVALCGVSNRQTIENFGLLARMTRSRPEPPPLIASTLLVPGYVDEEEVSRIAAFIAGIDCVIPYSLLAFHPQFMMDDLPITSRIHAERCREAALAAGLQRVHIGNVHLLLRSDYDE
ncbi:MAG: radical SAM protein [Candidatus Abyssubacteria bacterium]